MSWSNSEPGAQVRVLAIAWQPSGATYYASVLDNAIPTMVAYVALFCFRVQQNSTPYVKDL
ncbi:MAG: hypothetical protein JSV68_16000 [Anaerolineaceae bacterium]|nr:MAG: hypothetical protein JSV68_16000 [Anaerolineaceae bacterium]